MFRNRGLYGHSRSAVFSGAPVIPPFDPNNFPNFPSEDVGGVYPVTVNLVTQGDSLTATGAQASPGPASWLPFLAQRLGTQIQVTNVAQGGQTLANMVLTGASVVDTLLVRTPGVINVCTYQGGINDIIDGGGGGGVTAATIVADYFAFADARIAAGWDLVIPISIEASNYWNNVSYGNIDYNTVAAAIRAGIIAHSKSVFVDIPNDPILGPALSWSNIAWYLDNTHKTVNGDSRKCNEIIYPPIQAILAPTDLAAGNAIFRCNPPNGPIGATTPVGVSVTNLPPMAGHTITVTIGGQVCTSVTWDPDINMVYCTVPTGSASGNVVVTVDGIGARGGTGLWTALNAIIVDSIQPNIALAAGNPITIHADPAGATFAGGMVPTLIDPVLGLVSCTSVVIVSPYVMTAVLPALTPTVSGVAPLNLEVGGSIDTTLTRMWVLPSNVSLAYVPCADLYSGGTLKDLTGSFPLTQPTGSKQPTLVTSGFGGAPSLQHVAANSQTLTRNLTPAAQAIPYGAFAVTKVNTIANGGIFGSNAPEAGFLVIGGGAIWWLSGSSALETSSGRTFPGNLLVANINSTTTGKIYIDNVDTGATVTPTLLATGPGAETGFHGGFYGDILLGMCGLTNAPFTTQQLSDIHWISQGAYVTPP